MKSIMLSTQPKWCELIVSGKKTIEVRKTAPSETPFKCYIYETKGLCDTPTFIDEDGHISYRGRGQVMGEFVCDKVERFTVGSMRCDDIERMACLSYSEMLDYFYKSNELDGKTVKFGYAWYISDLKIYDTPKELGEFYKYGFENDYDAYMAGGRGAFNTKSYKVTRAPQSYCYVEELSE
ncbi:MAG: ASCH domain-containing protein [Clostridiales bacterium]|nr:ASCH domain-containing protein [Clostridiales bacterium]